MNERVRAPQILLAAFTTYRRRFRRVAGAALIVLVPLAIVNAFLVSETERFERLSGWIPEWLNVLNSGAAAVGSLGAIFYAGLLDRVVASDQRGHPEFTVREVLRSLPYLRLIGADVLLGLVTIVGLVLLVVPGIVAYTYFSLIGPLITSEGLGIRAAFRRSARLVRGHFWLVLVLVTIPLGVEEALIGIVEEIDIAHELAAVVLLQVVLAVGVTALVGLVAVTLAYELAGRESPGEELLESR